MWKRAVFLMFASCAMTPIPVYPQEEPVADFRVAQEQFAAGQTRQAANTLLRSTLYIRQQVGRSKDEVVGMQLLDAEAALEKLAIAIREGRAGSAKTVVAALVRIDRLLAHHHVQMATGALSKPRTEELPVIARDIRRSAYHYERSFTLDSKAPAPEVMVLLTDVRTLAGEIESTQLVPKHASATLLVFERQLTGATIITTASR
jgi:hypothetical protein